ncbi:tRNA-dihydrouridine(47) synthase [NAD(P)(+)]-like protein [Apophysomyces ossiformis]|uniref:tRNA-dihydrouridine(47) synthase [NAD(P)(+)] n=1 Tax=Apophysomyces ossiformis TaxID=679940 RepID=A0A8H7BSW1_9FUNG|nr:tRNA-dihydrouridine(47) synthase [NAD(P)(+)]-like protein [Apophysomyces ossiformis]
MAMAEQERRPGQASIKAEFRKETWFDDGKEEDIPTGFGDEEEEGKKFKEENPKKRVRGANKGQRGKKRIVDSIQICPNTARGDDCPFAERCRYSHDLEAYLATKPPDLGNKCIQFDLFGVCRRGYKCRFLNAHMDENKKLIINEELVKKNPVYTKNGIGAEAQRALTKFTYEFPKTKAYMVEVEAEIKAEEEMKAANRKRRLGLENNAEDDAAEASDEPPLKKEKIEGEAGDKKVVEKTESVISNAVPEEKNDKEEKEKNLQISHDEDLPEINMNVEPEQKPLGPIDEQYRKIIDFSNKTYLAPLTTVGNLPFRRICKEYGVDITCGEMAMAKNLLMGQQSEWALTKRHVSEDIFGVQASRNRSILRYFFLIVEIQICGGKVEQVVKACEAINNEIEVDFVDLNMGCPIDLVFNSGAGSALMDAKGRMNKILKGMTRVLDVPVTVKFRTGVKENTPTAHKLIPRLEEMNIALGTLHGRSRMQRYTKLANWDYISEVKNLTNNLPLYGNGDVLSFEDYNRCKSETGVDGIMMGRGALIKPWIFEEIKNQRHWDISSRERFDMLKRFCDYGLEHWGTDSQGLNIARRYIPVGLLEVIPQKMNERAPPYQGRDELETLMASPKASDWVKLRQVL